MNKLYCNDGCQKEFRPTQIKTGTEILEGNIERHYIECPHCKQQYTSYYIDDEMRQMQSQIKMLQQKEPLKVKQRNRLNKLIRKMQFRSNQIKLEVEGK